MVITKNSDDKMTSIQEQFQVDFLQTPINTYSESDTKFLQSKSISHNSEASHN